MVADVASDVSASGCEPALVQAMLADHYRDEGVAPLAPDAFSDVTAGMDDADWQRFAVIVGTLARPEVRATIPGISKRMPVRDQIEKGMVGTAKALKTIDLRVLHNMVRAEEFARRVARGLGIAFVGETPAESAARLAKIDYARLLGKVDAAKASAEEQMAALLAQQDDEDNRIRRRRRGKW
jgi:hypothetical protein